eukprot:3053404-Prymnesium_polylepis.1
MRPLPLQQRSGPPTAAPLTSRPPRPAAARPGSHTDETPPVPGHAAARASASSAAPTVYDRHRHARE